MTTPDFFIQVTLENDAEAAIIRSNSWESESPSIQVLLSKSSHIFAGKVDRQLWKSFADCFEQDPTETFEQNRKALTSPDETLKYKYNIKTISDNSVTLTWSKELDGGVVAKCGDILLNFCPEVSAFDFVRNCVGFVTYLTQEVEVQRTKATKAEADSAQLLKEYEQILQGRIAAEEELLAKFHALLNAKKRKIRDLQVEQY